MTTVFFMPEHPPSPHDESLKTMISQFYPRRGSTKSTKSTESSHTPPNSPASNRLSRLSLKALTEMRHERDAKAYSPPISDTSSEEYDPTFCTREEYEVILQLQQKAKAQLAKHSPSKN